MTKKADTPEDLSHISEGLRGLAVPIETLKPDPKNARYHPERNIEAIANSLRRFGQRKPVIVQTSTQIVRAGNGLIEAARRLGWTHVAALPQEDDDATAAAFAIADNRSGDLSAWNDESLLATLDGIAGVDPEMLSDLEFTVAEVESLRVCMDSDNPRGIDGAEEGPEPMEVPELMDDPTTKPGDLWILGQHRLSCGDSGSIADVERLLDGEDVQLVYTDPPYNVDIQSRSRNAFATGSTALPTISRGQISKMRPKDRTISNDVMSNRQYYAQILSWFGNIARVLVPGGIFYLWGGYSNWLNYCQALETYNLYFAQAIVWVKDHPFVGRKDFMNDAEFAWYGWKEGAGHKFYGPANITNVWHVKKIAHQARLHLTEKPVELAIRAIRYSSRRGENVLDLFGGSGSTLMACERMMRRGFLMELDPAYCDVIVQRWEKDTGQKAHHEPAEVPAEEQPVADA